MERSYTSNIQISKITLGTAQLGLEYGIANKTGKPDFKSAYNILQLAVDSGINTFDTAPVYGNSEEIIGDFFKNNTVSKKPIIVTKIPSMRHLDRNSSFETIYNEVKQRIINSANKLSLKQLHICLLHDATDMKNVGGLVTRSLIKLRNEGFVKMIGVSVYDPKDVKEFLEVGKFDVIQVPLNLFDTRLLKEKLLDELNHRKIITFARSVFLQGLFFLDPNSLPSHLSIAEQPLRQLRKISSESGRNIQELALIFVRDLPGITSMVLGVETTNQLKDNINLINRAPLSDSLQQKIFNLFSDLSQDLIDPSRWKMKGI